MRWIKNFLRVLNALLAFLLSIGYRFLFFWRTNKGDCKRVLNFGADLYALSRKGNLNHVWSLYNPQGIYEKVFAVCLDPRSLHVPIKQPWLVPVLVSRFFWLEFLQLAVLCRQQQIGMLRCRGPETAFMGLCLKIALGVPIVLSTGGNHRLAQDLQGYYPFGSRWLTFLIESMAYRYVDVIFCINRYTRRLIGELGGGVYNLLVDIPIRIDTEMFDRARFDAQLIRRRENIDDRTRVVLFVGRLERDKEVDDFFRAIPLIIERFPDTVFYVVGEGSLRSMLEDMATHGGFLDKVVFEGFVSNEKLPEYYSLAHVVCIPVSGFVIFEAAAMQKPVVAFDVDWHSEFIEDGVTGFLVPNKDVEAMARKVVELLRNDDLSERLAANAHQKFVEEYDPQTSVRKEAVAITNYCQGLSR